MEGLGEIRVELRQHGASIDAHHTAIGVLRERAAAHDTKIQVLLTELREGREDVGDLRSQFTGVSQSFYIAAAAMAGLMISICGLIATLLAN